MILNPLSIFWENYDELVLAAVAHMSSEYVGGLNSVLNFLRILEFPEYGPEFTDARPRTILRNAFRESVYVASSIRYRYGGMYEKDGKEV